MSVSMWDRALCKLIGHKYRPVVNLDYYTKPVFVCPRCMLYKIDTAGELKADRDDR